MNVRAKFQCHAKGQYEVTVWDEEHKNPQPGIAYRYEFYAVAGGSDENNKFFASTPGGSITLYAVRDDLFVPGQSYYLDFSAAQATVG
jgi:hypothetical protein